MQSMKSVDLIGHLSFCHGVNSTVAAWPDPPSEKHVAYETRWSCPMLIDSVPSLSGLTYFLTTSQRDGESSSLVEVYLQRCPECEHVLQPLGWGKEMRTHDVVSSTCSAYVCTCLRMGHRACTHACGPRTSSCIQNHSKSSFDLTSQRVCSHFYYACWSVCNQDQDFGLAKMCLIAPFWSAWLLDL